MGRTLQWLRSSCQTDDQGSISASCTRRGSLEGCSSLSRSSPSAFSWFDSTHLCEGPSGHITDKLPTSYWHITNCRPTVGGLIVYVLGKTCRLSVGRQTANSRPTVFLESSSSQKPHFTLIWSSTMLFSTATTKMHIFCFKASLTAQNNFKNHAFSKISWQNCKT